MGLSISDPLHVAIIWLIASIIRHVWHTSSHLLKATSTTWTVSSSVSIGASVQGLRKLCILVTCAPGSYPRATRASLRMASLVQSKSIISKVCCSVFSSANAEKELLLVFLLVNSLGFDCCFPCTNLWFLCRIFTFVVGPWPPIHRGNIYLRILLHLHWFR